MELTKREFSKIFDYYHVSDLDLVFDGFESINPDKKLYYWHNSENKDLYVVVLADYISEFSGDEAENYITENYWPEHTCNWEVDQWLSYDIYESECGGKCVFAKLKANADMLSGRELERDIPEVSEIDMAAKKEQLDKLTEIDSQR